MEAKGEKKINFGMLLSIGKLRALCASDLLRTSAVRSFALAFGDHPLAIGKTRLAARLVDGAGSTLADFNLAGLAFARLVFTGLIAGLTIVGLAFIELVFARLSISGLLAFFPSCDNRAKVSKVHIYETPGRR